MGHPVVAYLVSLAVGYWLLTLAEKQNGHTKTLGQVFAWIIIVVSLLGPVCMAASAWCRHANDGACGYSERGGWGERGWRHHGMGTSSVDGQCPMMGGKDGMKGMTGGKMDKAAADNKESSK
jgi:hypothetical protein